MIVHMNDTNPKAEVRRNFDLPVERLFDAWLDTSLLSQWMFGPNIRDEQLVRLGNEARDRDLNWCVVRSTPCAMLHFPHGREGHTGNAREPAREDGQQTRQA
jgi:hypothetical protein